MRRLRVDYMDQGMRDFDKDDFNTCKVDWPICIQSLHIWYSIWQGVHLEKCKNVT